MQRMVSCRACGGNSWNSYGCFWGSRRTQSAPVSVVDVAQQHRELELTLSIPDGLEVAQLLKGLDIPVPDLYAQTSSFRQGTFRSDRSSEGLHTILQYVEKKKKCDWIALSSRRTVSIGLREKAEALP